MREIADHGLSDDDGSADTGLRQALASAAAGGDGGAALALLLRSRVIVPVVAVPDADQPDTSSSMAAVLMTGRDGRRALLAFSGTDALTAWDGQARPVPMPLGQAAQAAVAEGATAVVVDVAGPAMHVLEGDDLRQAAAGSVLVRVGDRYGWVRREDAEGTTGPV